MAKKNLRPPPAYPGMTIGLFGGTFDPPHEGHRNVSDMALKRLGLDRIWWLVTPGNPLKSRADTTMLDKRIERVRDFARHPRVDVTGFEAALSGSYSAETIAFLVGRYPEVRFVWIMGADNLASFHRWRLWREIMWTLPLAVFDRPGYRHAAMSARAVVSFARYRVDESDAAGTLALSRSGVDAADITSFAAVLDAVAA